MTLNTEALGTPPELPAGSPEERTVEVTVGSDDRIRHVETFEVPEEDLAKARRIVAGGFGLGTPDGFDLVRELADTLGAAVGASRPPSDEGWIPYDRQIGVTGKEIDVELYLPVAISGDSYHMRSVNAEYLIPINTDPEARIFNFADIGIVGDAYESMVGTRREVLVVEHGTGDSVKCRDQAYRQIVVQDASEHGLSPGDFLTVDVVDHNTMYAFGEPV